MINKKNLLGKAPAELGTKDAIHVAIVAVRAASPIKPGQRCGINENHEAIPKTKGPGVADPFLKKPVATGEPFWMVMDLSEVPNVTHHWDHPTLDFSPPVTEPKYDTVILQYAESLGVTYKQLLDACAYVVEHDEPAPYPNTNITPSEQQEILQVLEDAYDIWYCWMDATGYKFYNSGTGCCPEYDFPECQLFKWEEQEEK